MGGIHLLMKLMSCLLVSYRHWDSWQYKDFSDLSSFFGPSLTTSLLLWESSSPFQRVHMSPVYCLLCGSLSDLGSLEQGSRHQAGCGSSWPWGRAQLHTRTVLPHHSPQASRPQFPICVLLFVLWERCWSLGSAHMGSGPDGTEG